jgi:hypothetical protein
VTAIFQSLFILLIIAGYGIIGIVLLSRGFYSVIVELVELWRTKEAGSRKVVAARGLESLLDCSRGTVEIRRIGPALR